RPRLFRMICLRKQIRHMLGRMSRRVARRDNHFAKFKSLAILDFLRAKTVLCAALAAGVNLCRFQLRAQFARAAHQIGMNMGLENVRDSEAGLTRRFNVNVAISSRIMTAATPSSSSPTR